MARPSQERKVDEGRSQQLMDAIEESGVPNYVSLLSEEEDQVLWESKFIESFKKEFGRLPRYNEQAGATIHLLN